MAGMHEQLWVGISMLLFSMKPGQLCQGSCLRCAVVNNLHEAFLERVLCCCRAAQESDALQSEVSLLTADRARLTREVRQTRANSHEPLPVVAVGAASHTPADRTASVRRW